MPAIEDLLQPLAARAEAEVRPRLNGFLGGMLRQYLPQVWVFQTDAGTASLCVATDGSASIAPGAVTPSDVTVEVGYARLKAALARSSGGKIPPGPVTVTPHTAKGRAAFDYLRGRLGL